jgi:hypothetical protein
VKKNVGSADRFIRFLIGAALLVNILVLKPGTTGTIILAVAGAAILATSFIGFCSLYIPFGICTVERCRCSEEKKES